MRLIVTLSPCLKLLSSMTVMVFKQLFVELKNKHFKIKQTLTLHFYKYHIETMLITSFYHKICSLKLPQLRSR